MRLTLVVLMSVAVQAHSTAELDTWVEDWDARRPDLMTVEHATEWRDMMNRHIWYLIPPAQKTRSLPDSPPPVSGGVEQWRGLVAAHFPASEVDRALCVMWHESRGNPSAKNPTSTARGLMQILASLWAPHFGVSYDDLYDPETNMRIARAVWDSQGWWAWSPYRIRGLCR